MAKNDKLTKEELKVIRCNELEVLVDRYLERYRSKIEKLNEDIYKYYSVDKSTLKSNIVDAIYSEIDVLKVDLNEKITQLEGMKNDIELIRDVNWNRHISNAGKNNIRNFGSTKKLNKIEKELRVIKGELYSADNINYNVIVGKAKAKRDANYFLGDYKRGKELLDDISKRDLLLGDAIHKEIEGFKLKEKTFTSEVKDIEGQIDSINNKTNLLDFKDYLDKTLVDVNTSLRGLKSSLDDCYKEVAEKVWDKNLKDCEELIKTLEGIPRRDNHVISSALDTLKYFDNLNKQNATISKKQPFPRMKYLFELRQGLIKCYLKRCKPIIDGWSNNQFINQRSQMPYNHYNMINQQLLNNQFNNQGVPQMQTNTVNNVNSLPRTNNTNTVGMNGMTNSNSHWNDNNPFINPLTQQPYNWSNNTGTPIMQTNTYNNMVDLQKWQNNAQGQHP